MANEDEPFEPPRYRSRRAIELMIAMHKRAVAELHVAARSLTGREAKELRDIADDMDEYAEYLRNRLYHPRFRKLP